MKKLVWDPNARIILELVYETFPQAVIDVCQVEPVPDDNIPSRPISFIKDYDGLLKFIRAEHWSGDATAVYQWTARTLDNPRVGRGTIVMEKAT